MENRFDRDTLARPLGGGRFAARIDPGWWVVAGPNGDLTDEAKAKLLRALHDTGALESTREVAIREAEAACRAIAGLPETRAKEALFTVARATVHRES